MTRAVALAVLLASSAAWAQSKKYPFVPPDKDLEAEQRSDLWESALHPDRMPYKDLVKEAKNDLGRHLYNDALEKLEAAIARIPNEPEAYVVRGGHYLTNKVWTKCADDLTAAENHTKTDDGTRTRLRLDLGICLGRAGRFAEAERTLVRASATATSYRGEIWERLGEVRVALGKLDEGVDALLAAVEAGETTIARWLLAIAHDRSRRLGDAQDYTKEARRFDSQLSQLQSPALPHLGLGDTEYFLGVAHQYGGKPEYALLYFRRFLVVAPESPWRRRAEDHIRELEAVFPSADSIVHEGSTPIVINELRATLRKSLARLRTCVARHPTTAFKLTITRVGPRTPESVRDRPILRAPSAGSKASILINMVGATDTTEAEACLVKASTNLLPLPKGLDTHYTVSFVIVSK